MAFLTLKDVSFSYNDKSRSIMALRNINLEVDESSFVTILGTNGSGKSTLGKLLNALLVPQKGSVIINGLSTSDSLNLYEIRKTVGLVFQNPENQIVADCIEDDVAFGPENIGLESLEIRKRIDESLYLVSLDLDLKTKPEKLSGGQKQRLAIASIMALEPRCIVLDESTSMLDAKCRREVVSAINNLRKEKNITVILITHNMEEALLSDYIYVLDKGSIVLSGSPKDVFKETKMLNELGLELPLVCKTVELLKQKGIDITLDEFTEEELVAKLIKLKESIC